MGVYGVIVALGATLLSVFATLVGLVLSMVWPSGYVLARACWVDHADVSTLLRGKQPGEEEEEAEKGEDEEASEKDTYPLNGAGGQSSGSVPLNEISRTAGAENQGMKGDPVSGPVAVIIPALNESLSLSATLRRLRSLRPAPALVVVADGGSTDGTPEIAERMGAVVVRCKEKGRAKQMNAGAQEAAKRLELHWHTDGKPANSEAADGAERLEFGWGTDGTLATSERGGETEGLGFGRCSDGVPDQDASENTDPGKREGAGWYTDGMPGQDSHGHTSTDPAQAAGMAHERGVLAKGGGDVEEGYYEGWKGGLYPPHALGKGGRIARDSGLFCFLHADTIVPKDFVRTVSGQLAETRNCCIGFVPLIAVPGRIFWFLTLADVAKTWVCSALQSPRAYLKGQRTLYGDQAICCRADDFWSIRGFNEDLPILEDTDFCERLHGQYMASGVTSRIALIPRLVVTSGRRFVKRGVLKSLVINLRFAYAYLIGASPAVFHSMYVSMYKDVR